MKNTYVMCRINAQLNRERELTYTPAARKKKVLVVGAGPSGMEAARVAAMRGHEVYLYDKQTKLGGLIALAGLLKDVEVDDMMAWVHWFKIQFDKSGVKIRLGQEVTPSIIEQIKPDVIIAAVGGKQVVPQIKGLETAKVTTGAALHRQLKFYLRFFSPQSLAKLTKIWMPVGKNVVIVGGKIQGCETAEFLAKRGRQVTIVDTAETMGEGMTSEDKYLLFPWFDKKNVKTYLGVNYHQIDSKGLEITAKDGRKVKLEADTFITALPLEPNLKGIKEFEGKATEVYFVGDGVDPKLIAEAVANGAKIGNSI
jgi:2,4-dienoyl-CoA reductase (NADPH2)